MSPITSFRQSVYDIFRLSYFFKIFYIRTRKELPLILNRKGLLGEGVEVGVWKADFSNFLLTEWKGEKLHSVDPWKNFSADVYIDDMNISQDKFDEIFSSVQTQLSKYGDRSSIVRELSLTASLKFKDNSLDFVYLDARHDYEGVKEDINVWYPKVKVAGIICGHDYLDTKIENTIFGVKKAVDEFAKENNLKKLITKKDLYPSWFIIKL